MPAHGREVGMAPLLKAPRGARRGQGILLLGSVDLLLTFPMAAQGQQPADYIHRRASMTMREEEL